MKRTACLLLLLVLLPVLAGCRVRTSSLPGEAAPVPEQAGGPAEDSEAGESDSASALSGAASGTEPGEGEAGEDPSSGTRENPLSPRKEYDESASVEVLPGTGRPLQSEGEGDGAPFDGPEGSEKVSRLQDRAEETAEQTVAADESDRTGVDPDADAADSAFTYYSALLSDRTGSLYECQRSTVYWETSKDLVTVYRTSPEHALILTAGADDVSARLLEENLKVGADWVVRKNPGVIVRVADRSVLGGGVWSSSAAEALRRSLGAREGWSGINAVRNHRIILLSEDLLESPHLRLAAALILAKTANPDLFRDLDPAEALEMLMQEAAGTPPQGIFYLLEE